MRKFQKILCSGIIGIKKAICKNLIFYQNSDGYVVTKGMSVIESDPESGKSHAICKICGEKNYIKYLKLIIQ